MSKLIDDLREAIEGRDVLIVGLGNRIRGDDGVGAYVAEELLKRGVDNVLNAENAVENVLSIIAMKKPDVIILIDAIDGELEPGNVIFGTLEGISDKGCRLITTHNMPLTLMMEILKELMGKMPRVYILGIQIERIDVRDELSPRVKESADIIVGILQHLLSGSQSYKPSIKPGSI
ncbi:MAG: hydrogenase maturation protease [Thermoprotei archaeon]|nr:hydrogenase maturation protease [Thermoprotei archaeon]